MNVILYFVVATFLKKSRQALQVAHVYNPSYSGGGDYEDQGVKPAGRKFERLHFNQLKSSAATRET
jgi:hypothetical protein